MTATWTKAIGFDQLTAKGRAVVRLAGKQIALFATADGVLACNNRCPHEGYPLSEGELDGGCVLTCNWHNWKFDLTSGANLLGGDRLRVYPTELRNGEVWLDLADPPAAMRQAEILVNLREAFDEQAYQRLARELVRLGQAGADPCSALVDAIVRAHDRLEFGWTHAFAATADWLALRDEHAGDNQAEYICLLEAIGHIADDVLREATYAYPAATQAYDEDGLVAAVEAEDEAAAVAMVRGGLDAGLGFAGLERGLSRAALAHYNDFGHALIYVAKAGRLVDRLGPAVALPLTLSLTRSIVYATREDQIPEFRAYAPALAAWGEAADAAPPEPAAYRGLDIRRAIALTAAHAAAPAAALYRALLGANAWNLLHYDTAYQERTDGSIADNVGWLNFTHGITFANAVRRQCGQFPDLWPAGLLQLACFTGRNAPYTDAALDGDAWRVDDGPAFLESAVAGLFDHGVNEYIVSAHLLKTVLAAREEVQSGAAGPSAGLLVAALNRFLNSKLKRKHARRTVHQAMAFVALDG